MNGRTRRVLAGIGWVVASFVAWGVVCNVVAAVVVYLVNERRVMPPQGADTALVATMLAGVVLIPPAVAVLAMRGRLPWTGQRAATTRVPGAAVCHRRGRRPGGPNRFSRMRKGSPTRSRERKRLVIPDQPTTRSRSRLFPEHRARAFGDRLTCSAGSDVKKLNVAADVGVPPYRTLLARPGRRDP